MSTLGRPRVHLRRVGSTNDHARALALAGAPHGTLVTAAGQTAGRGRQGRSWSAPAGSSLLMSLILRSGEFAAPTTILPLAAAVAVCDAAGPEARVKWPNDIVLPRGEALAKLAGILVEGRPQQGWAVLGIGLNVAVRLEELPPQLRDSAATLGRTREAIEPLLATLLIALERRLGDPVAQTLQAWRARDALREREIAWSGGRGRAAGIDEDGRLLVTLASGDRTALLAGEVHLES
ncbi:MAG TPA: biotin--[acetyl-CoA-carboxylase] ligase [Solirubrobacteraceae bacterium]|jgi:BirA family biotin operon repressor/biotin-[acetyl-CoA-carboxylase] ligase